MTESQYDIARGIAVIEAKRQRKRGTRLEMDELIAAGMAVAVEAARKFDQAKATWPTYCHIRVVGAIRDRVNHDAGRRGSHHGVVRYVLDKPIGEDGTPLHELIAWSQPETPDPYFRKVMDWIMKQTTRVKAEAVRARYLEGTNQSGEMKALALRDGVTQAAISMRVRYGLQDMREAAMHLRDEVMT